MYLKVLEITSNFDSKLLSAKIKDEVKMKSNSYKRTPILAVITIGYDKPSEIFFNELRKMCEYTDISIMHFDYVDFVKESVVIRKIKELNKDDNVTGILLELPIPSDFNLDKILNSIDPIKNIDSFNEYYKTAKVNSILEIFNYNNIDIKDKHICIICDEVDEHLVKELVDKNAVVTISKEKYINSDILIVLKNRRDLINENDIKKNSIVIDGGCNVINNIVYGSVNYKNKIILGPLICSFVLKNLMYSYERQIKKS